MTVRELISELHKLDQEEGVYIYDNETDYYYEVEKVCFFEVEKEYRNNYKFKGILLSDS